MVPRDRPAVDQIGKTSNVNARNEDETNDIEEVEDQTNQLNGANTTATESENHPKPS